jgi:hypothetical protein
MSLLGTPQEVTKKRAKGYAFGNRVCAALHSKRRDLIKRPQGVLQGKPIRAAGGESKMFCLSLCSKFHPAQGA